jgi:hypothetical protein
MHERISTFNKFAFRVPGERDLHVESWRGRRCAKRRLRRDDGLRDRDEVSEGSSIPLDGGRGVMHDPADGRTMRVQ